MFDDCFKEIDNVNSPSLIFKDAANVHTRFLLVEYGLLVFLNSAGVLNYTDVFFFDGLNVQSSMFDIFIDTATLSL